MTLVYLVRHGRSSANTQGVLAGWTPDVHLDDVGRDQAQRVSDGLADVHLNLIVASPLDRTRETAETILDGQRRRVDIALDARVGECHYGDWTGQRLTTLSRKPLWKTVQNRPSHVRFPGPEGETLLGMQARALDAVADYNTRLPAHARYALVSHGDVIKSILADALGMPFDSFQRIAVDPGSVSVIDYGATRPTVLTMNDNAAALSVYQPSTAQAKGTVGGGAGPAQAARGKAATSRSPRSRSARS